MQIIHRVKNNICWISLKDDPVEKSAPKPSRAKELQERLTPLLEETALAGVVLDFKNLEHISSGEIGDIVSFFQILEKRQIQLVLCQMNEKLSMLFRMTDLDKILPIFPTEKEALACFAQGGDSRKE